MAVIEKTTQTSQVVRVRNAVVVPSSHGVRDGWQIIPDSKVSGSYITFADGSKFRRATALAKSNAWIERKSPAVIRGKWISGTYKGQPVGYDSSIGGYNEYAPLTSNYADSLKAGGLNSLIRLPSIPTSLRNEVITKALLDFADQKVNLGENLATLQQTLRLFTSPSSSLTKLLRELSHVGRTRKFLPYLKKSLRDIKRAGPINRAAEEYLKYVYGWKPLMQDVYGLVELAKEYGDTPLLLHATQRATETAQTGTVEGDNLNSKRVFGPLDIKTRVLTSLWARIDPNYQGTRALNQLGLTNPASLAWELVPYSFVVDWVLPIGPVLQALTAPAGLIFVDGSVSSRVSATGPWSEHYDGHGGTSKSISQLTPALQTVRYEGYRRETVTSWPRPGLWFDRDPFKGDRSFKALALLILSLKSKR